MKKDHSEYQKKYRHTLTKNGLVRFEIQISKENKQLFEAIATDVSAEFLAQSPNDEKKRMKRQ